jgi:serine/threonine-protein kinase
MGEVYRATDTKLGRDVAIKLLPASISNDPQCLARFEREAKALAALNHPHIAGIYGFEAEQGTHFLVLELVEGETLSERLQRGPMPLKEALAVARQMAEAIQEAHQKGIVHRDLKPGNVKITPNGRVKVLDFGLAKMEQSFCSETGTSIPPAADAATLPADGTRPGVVMGTPAYMSPEQARGQEVDKRTDIWAFGCCMYERKPFHGQTRAT